MKKILLILCALVCGTLAFAQTGTYTGNLHLRAGNDDEGVTKSTVTVVYDSEEDRTIDFTLHDFSVGEIALGDVTVNGVILGETVDGVATFSCTEDHDVSVTDESYGPLIQSGLVTATVNMTGDISEESLHATMDINVAMFGASLISVTAEFGYEDNDYLIVNVETGYYLGGGLAWGTQVTEIGKPQFFTFEGVGDNAYHLNGHQHESISIGYPDDAEDNSLYVDAALPLTWELVAADGGGYYIATDEGYLTGNGFQEAVTIESNSSDATVWKLVTMDDVLATMADATISEPVDVTPLIPAPEPKRNNWKNSWVATGYNENVEPSNCSFGTLTGWEVGSVCESNNSTNGFDIRQTFSLPKAGYYELTAQAFYRNDGGTVIPSMYVTTGTSATDTNGSFENIHLPEHYTESGNMTDAYNEFLEGLYPVSLPFVVDNEGDEITVGFESNVEDEDKMWSIFGELGLTYLGTELPTLTAVSGMMNAEVEATQTAALEAYASTPTSATFAAAEQSIIDAEESVAYYKEITAAIESEEYKEVLATFDADGQAAFENDFMAAYTACTLTNETIEDGLAAACKKQTTEFCDMSYALKNSGEWVNAIGASSFQLCPQLSTAHEIWSSGAWSLGRDVLEKEAIYKQIEDLPEGTYTLSFYAYGSEAQDANTRPLAYATGAEEDQEVAYIGELGSAWTRASLYTFVCEVGEDGILQFGMKSQGNGSWYVMEEYSLTFGVVEEDPYIYDITSLLANPSFEVDDISTLTYDETRGAYEVDSPEGWTLTGEPGVSDIMTADATATDNNFGVPGEPSDGTQMLYLRNAWVDNKTVTLLQDLTLPAGDYKITVDTKCVSNTGSTATLVAGDESVSLTIHDTANGSEETKGNPFLDAWDTAVLKFTLTEPTDVNLGIDIIFNGGNGSFLLDNFQLFSTEEVETVEYANDVTWALANPSFEVDNVVANLTVDTGRSITDEDGNLVTACAWSATSLTGWTLPTLSGATYGVSDLMTSGATSTDNNFGVPGDPSDGSQMLYIRDAWQNDEDVKLTQELTLPAGDYKITVDTKCVSTSTSKATLFAGDKSKALTIHGTSNGTDATKTNPFLDAWDTATLTFSLETEATVSVGIEFEFYDNGSFLLDNFKLYSVSAIEKEISWTMTDAGWGTMILPFAVTLEEGLTAYSCAGTTTDDETETTTVDLTEVGQSIVANTPYIIKCTDDSAIKEHTFTGTPTNTVETYTEGILTGTLVDLAVAKGAAFATDGTVYLLQNHVDENGEEVDDGLAFYPIIAATEDADNSKDATLDAYHCYLDLSLVTTSARPVALHFPGAGETTGIVAVESETLANDAIYDLSGRRVSKAVKGVYIQNGKKVLVK